MPKFGGGQARVLTRDEFEELLGLIAGTAHAKRDILMLRLSYNLGLRAIEISRLKLRHVLNPDETLASEITIDKCKRGKPRTLYLEHRGLRQAVLDYIEERKKFCEKERIDFTLDAPLILSQWNGAFNNRGIQQRFRTLYRIAKYFRCSSHSGRRTFANVLFDQGAEIKAIQRILGHVDASTTIIYLDTNADKMRSAMSKMNF